MNVQRAELGPRVVERLRAFEVAFGGGCGHDEDQWAGVGSLRSSCLHCLRAAAPAAPWERPGPCDCCNRLMAEAAVKTWAVPSSVGVTAVLRLCDECVATEVLALGEPEDPEGDEMGKTTRLPLTAWLSITAGAAPPEDYSTEDLATMCCRECAQAWSAARHRGGDGLRLHRDCREGIGRAAERDLARSKRGGADRPKAFRVALLRGVLAVEAAEVRP